MKNKRNLIEEVEPLQDEIQAIEQANKDTSELINHNEIDWD